MSARLNPYVMFNGNAQEAMEFYKGVFGGDLRLNTFGEYGAPEPGTAGLGRLSPVRRYGLAI